MALAAAKPEFTLPSSGEVAVSILDTDILSLDFCGHVDGEVARRAVVGVRQALQGRRARVILCNTLSITEVDMSARQHGHKILDVATQHGITRSFCAASSTVVRVIGAALALTAGVRIHFFATMDEARAAASSDLSPRR